MGGVLGQEDTSYIPQAVFWFVVMFGAGVAAWLADRSLQNGRRMAIGAAGAFFVVGLFSTVVFSVLFVMALLFAVGGIAGTSRPGDTDKPEV